MIQEQPLPGLELNGVPLYPLPRTALESNDKEVFVDSTAVQVIHQIPHRTFPVPKEVEDGPPIGLTQDVEGGKRFHRSIIPIQLYTCQGILKVLF